MNLTLGNDRVFDMIHQLGKKYGPVFTLQMGWYPFIVINDFNLMKEAFIKAADQCSNRFDYLPLLKIIGAKDVGQCTVNHHFVSLLCSLAKQIS